MAENEQGTALTASAQGEVEAIRQAGARAVATQAERNKVMRGIAGLRWGSVRGDNMSEETRWMMARMCELYDADPATDIDILNDRVYLKAEFYQRKLNALPNLLNLPEPINISAPYAKEMREQAKRMLKDADDFGDDSMRAEALALVKQAQLADQRRAHYAVPDFALAAYEVFAVLEGEESVRAECNYAPNDPSKDPVGKLRPGATALTRAYGRLARKVVPSLRTAESQALKEGVEAEFRIVASDQQAARTALPRDGERQALRVGAGEPTAARVEVAATGEAEATRRRGPGWPASRRETDEGRAAREKLERGFEALGVEDVAQFCVDHLGRLPETVEDYETLTAALSRVADEDGGL